MIVLAVAHSLLDKGAVSADGAITEHAASWVATQACETAMAARKIPTLLLRAGWLDQRAQLAAKVRAVNALFAQACVEIHLNASADYPDASYSEIIHHERSEGGKALAHAIDAAFAEGFATRHRWPRHGARASAREYMLAYTACPTVIVEPCFVSNADQAHWVSTGGAEAIGHMVADGVARWMAKTGG